MYKGIISQITVRPHGNADRLQLGLVHGHQVVVGLDVRDGDTGVFFPTDGALSPRMCEENDLYSASARAELLLPNSEKPGFFSTRRRVRAQKFRGEKSDGFWCELEKLAWTGVDLNSLTPGTEIDTLNGELVCEKYYTPATLRAMRRQEKSSRKLLIRKFPEHVDTAQFRYHVGHIPDASLIIITEKLHGTSGRFGNVLETRELSGWDRVRQWVASKIGIGVSPLATRYVQLNGTRHVILLEDTGPGFYGTHEFRYEVTHGLSLRKGEVIYFEIVGWVNETTPVMPSQPIRDELRDVQRVYGKEMRYTYGCPPGTRQMYVYRIGQVNESGEEVDLSWFQVVARCRELGLKTVPVLDVTYFYGSHELLEAQVSSLMEGNSTLDPTQIREGVVVRVENDRGTQYLKSKQWLFGVLEGYIKDDETAVDLEEVS